MRRIEKNECNNKVNLGCLCIFGRYWIILAFLRSRIFIFDKTWSSILSQFLKYEEHLKSASWGIAPLSQMLFLKFDLLRKINCLGIFHWSDVETVAWNITLLALNQFHPKIQPIFLLIQDHWSFLRTIESAYDHEHKVPFAKTLQIRDL